MSYSSLGSGATSLYNVSNLSPTYGAVREWSTEQVSNWLRDSNLSQHIDNFARNHINGEALLQIDQSHIKAIGITSVGERVRLNGAIRQLQKRYADAEARSRIGAQDTAHPMAVTDGAYDYPRVAVAPSPWPLTLADENAPKVLVSTPVSDPTTPIFARTQQSPGYELRPRTAAAVLGGQPAPHTTLQRPNTSAGVVWHAQAVPAAHARPATATAASSIFPVMQSTTAPPLSDWNGYSPSVRTAVSPTYAVKQDSENATPHVSPPTSAGITQHSGMRPNLEEIKMRTIKFIGFQGTTRIVDVSDMPTAATLLARVLRKFGLPQGGNIYEHGATAFGGSYGSMNEKAWAIALQMEPRQMLNEQEIETICRRPQAYDSVWHKGLYLCMVSHPSEVPWITVNDTTDDQSVGSVTTNGTTLRRASTLCILSGLGIERSNPSETDALEVSSLTLPVEETSKTSESDATRNQTKPSMRRRVRNFFGQRPPSELISSYLPVYFPKTELHLLEQYARPDESSSKHTSTSNLSLLSVDDSAYEPSLARRSSQATTRSRHSSILGESRDNASLLTVDEITKEIEDNRDDSQPSRSPTNSVLIIDDEVPDGQFHDDIQSPTTPVAQTSDVNVPSKEESVAKMRWHKGALIGAGSFGHVFLGMNASTGMLMAVKQVVIPPAGSNADRRRQEMLESLESEIELLKTLEHPNIVQYLGSCSDGEYLNIFLEYVPGGSVAALLRNYGAFEEQLVQNFVRQVLRGLNFLHLRGIVHRDIKGANILVDNKGGVKISDFGISKKVEHGLLLNPRSPRPSLQGSVFWMAPEVVKQTTHTRKADIWSVGCLVVEMISGTHPWPTLDQMQAIFRIGMNASPPLPDEISEDATNFLSETFEKDYTRRPSAAQLLEHTFLKSEVSI